MSEEEKDGCFNPSADKVERIDKTWSDTNLNWDFQNLPQWKNDIFVFTRLKCRNCGGLKFEVLSTGDYETSARCCDCGMYYIVHSG